MPFVIYEIGWHNEGPYQDVLFGELVFTYIYRKNARMRDFVLILPPHSPAPRLRGFRKMSEVFDPLGLKIVVYRLSIIGNFVNNFWAIRHRIEQYEQAIVIFLDPITEDRPIVERMELAKDQWGYSFWTKRLLRFRVSVEESSHHMPVQPDLPLRIR